ncbi:hypothetical protein BD769DRAFT_1661719 [Suillus cothurnatus]|nr:hypothetical protein BD769DRAFT_1661719 [Suillus cothurnatus]
MRSTNVWDMTAVENELNSLHCHTGAETILYMTRGSTNLPLHAVTFSTEGVQHFMHSVMNIDNQDFVSKMEGFTIQGMKGAVKNHQERVSVVRADIHNIINDGLWKITGNPRANMQWTHYSATLFNATNKVSSSLSELERLFDLWDKCIMCWKTLMDEEFAKIYQEHNEKLKNGQIEEIHQCTRSDKGKKHKRPAITNSNNKNTAHHKKYKSDETIEDSDKENDEDNGGETTPPPSPHQPSNTTPNITFSLFITTSNLTFEPSSTVLNLFPLHMAGSSLDHTNGSFNYDAALTRLDQIYGPAGSVQLSSAHVFDFTDINMSSSTF